MTEVDLHAALKLAEALWPAEDSEDLEKHFTDILHYDKWRTTLLQN